MEEVGGTNIMRKMTKTWGKDENLGGRKRQGRFASWPLEGWTPLFM